MANLTYEQFHQAVFQNDGLLQAVMEVPANEVNDVLSGRDMLTLSETDVARWAQAREDVFLEGTLEYLIDAAKRPPVSTVPPMW